MIEPPVPQRGVPFLAGGGEMGDLMRHHDWAQTPLGNPQSWPQSLKTAVRIMLTSRQPIWIGWGPELIYLYNDPYKSIIGGKHPWALGRPTKVVWREIWNDIGPMLATATTGDEGTYVESQLLLMERYGYPEETYYTFSYSPIPDDDGSAAGIICYNTDDTRRVIGERQLALLRVLAARTADARTRHDACARSGEALATNPRDLPFALIYASEPDGTMALAASCGIEPDDRVSAKVLAPNGADSPWPIGEAMRLHELCVLEDLPPAIADLLPPGIWQRPPTKVAVVPIPAVGGTGRGGALVVGINPFRTLDDAYRNFLSLVAGQISASIANAQAYEEERRRAESLTELDRAKTTFFSNVSHEFRTPLTLMLGPLQDAISGAHGSIPKPVVDELSVVHRNGLRLLKLVNTLLDFSRIEAGRVQAAYEPVDLANYTAELASVFRSAVERAGMTLTIDCPALGEPAYVDRSMWEKIVLNLLSNAFKFTLEGGITVRVRRSGQDVELSVRDTGSGIPEQELPRLFERFYRVEGTKGRTHEGTGIGLSLVQELVKLHGGGVSVESRPGEGSTFTVRVPLGSGHLPPDRVNATQALSSTALAANVFVEEAIGWHPEPADDGRVAYDDEPAGPARLSPAGTRPRIVLADDNADMRQYVRRLLANQYDVEAVGDGQAALAATRARRPSLVISDVMMPKLDGFGLLKAIRADEAIASVPVILLSARAGEEATLDGLEAGADDYLVKPFSARDLLGRVSALLERKRFQRELAAADDRLRIALSAARMVAWEWDPDADVTVTSDSVSEVFGLPAGARMKSSAQGFTILHPDDVEAHRAQLKGAVERVTSFHSQFRIIRPVDGSVAWMEERGTARRDEVTGKVRVVGVVMDVTAAKHAEQERERLLERERTARGEAERASRLKEDFLTTLSHELRTPLNAIVGWSQLLSQVQRDPETLAEGISVISRNARAQAQLIEDLLDMSRIASGKLRLEVQQVDLSDVISAAVESVRPAADAKGIHLIKAMDSARVPVAGDPHRLQQVVWNLLSNAIKFTPNGGHVQVVLEWARSHVEIRVADNGNGISPAFLPHVFERFRQADASTSRAYGGLGLGLAIVKQLVELHGGTVRAHSEGEGRGATFVVSLPLAVTYGREREREPSANTQAAGAYAPGQVSLAGVKVLVVDDEPDARGLVKRILEENKAHVTAAGSAEEALATFKRDRPHVIVSDIGMPGQDGYGMIQAIRALRPEDGGHVPAVALTAYARPQDRRQALLAGFQSHVAKPTDPAELVTVVASLAGTLGPAAAGRVN